VPVDDTPTKRRLAGLVGERERLDEERSNVTLSLSCTRSTIYTSKTT
jgi:hypothetical protein